MRSLLHILRFLRFLVAGDLLAALSFNLAAFLLAVSLLVLSTVFPPAAGVLGVVASFLCILGSAAVLYAAYRYLRRP